MNINERFAYCVTCDQNKFGELKKEPMTTVINGKVVTYIGEVLICSTCGEKIDTKEVTDYNEQAAKEAYNRMIEIEKETIENETEVVKCSNIGDEMVKKAIDNIKNKKEKQTKKTSDKKQTKKTVIYVISGIVALVGGIIAGIISKKKRK